MLADISNGIVNLTRGDSLELPVKINIGTQLEPVFKTLVGTTDKVYFGIMLPNQAFEDAVVKKVLDAESPVDIEGNPILLLSPEDTENLLVGKYYYTLKYRYTNQYGKEAVKTIKPSTLFWIMGENPIKEPEPVTYVDSLPENNVINNEVTKYKTIIWDGGEIG